jgi:hypothetical protein
LVGTLAIGTISYFEYLRSLFTNPELDCQRVIKVMRKAWGRADMGSKMQLEASKSCNSGEGRSGRVVLVNA